MPVRPVPLLCDPISHLEKLALLPRLLTFFALIHIWELQLKTNHKMIKIKLFAFFI